MLNIRDKTLKTCALFHQLNSSGFGVLNGLGLGRFLGLARDLAFVGPGMGNGVGLGLRLHLSSPITSLTSIVATYGHGVMQNHHPETISTWVPKTARQNFLTADPILDMASR